jgi:hypothetical protein
MELQAGVPMVFAPSFTGDMFAAEAYGKIAVSMTQ